MLGRIGAALLARVIGQLGDGCAQPLLSRVAAGDLSGIMAIADQPLWQIADARDRGQAQPEVEILAMLEGRMIAADREHHIAAIHHGGVAQEAHHPRWLAGRPHG
jgi:hypothetical protein